MVNKIHEMSKQELDAVFDLPVISPDIRMAMEREGILWKKTRKELDALIEQWRACAMSIMPDSMDYTASRNVWIRCADQLEEIIKMLEGKQ